MVVLLPCLITWNPHTTKRDNWCWIAKRANRIDSIRHEGKRAADRRTPLSRWNKRGNTISCVSVSPGFHPYTGFRKKKKILKILCHTAVVRHSLSHWKKWAAESEIHVNGGLVTSFLSLFHPPLPSCFLFTVLQQNSSKESQFAHSQTSYTSMSVSVLHSTPNYGISSNYFVLLRRWCGLSLLPIELSIIPTKPFDWKGEVYQQYCPHAWQGGKEEKDPPGINEPGRRSPPETVSPTDAPAFSNGADVACRDGYVMMHLWPHRVMIYGPSCCCCHHHCDWLFQRAAPS